ncbi:hypothetical protein QEH56_24265 [Pelagicoccus enzymogenes]|uniref:hypothetical protein n=1 Tax=Pelagicoccus enzymogenes TaxID=2773457 RepID=UPI00280CE479|nr:hypothetical protein [Pelagicoccus enzymogenes]MDQ8201297.1 hypothetical protein [Pelagicoccus enzymogenes]
MGDSPLLDKEETTTSRSRQRAQALAACTLRSAKIMHPAIYIALGLVIPFALVVLIGIYGGPVFDRSAQKKGKEYVERLGYEFTKSTVTSNHYGIYFRKDEKKYFAKYQYIPIKGMRWKGKKPEELVEQNEK